MDVSLEYVKMCERSKKYLPIKPSQGDFIANLSTVGGTYIFVNYLYQPEETNNEWHLICDDYSPNYLVPLLRQDQLQEMLYEINNDFSQPNIKYGITYVGCPDCIVKDLSKFSEQDCSLNLTSMEQLWLAFVMKEKFNKVWNGQDWVTN